MNRRLCNVISGPWNVNREHWIVIGGPCNVIKLPWNVNRGQWDVKM